LTMPARPGLCVCRYVEPAGRLLELYKYSGMIKYKV
jgi:hypothetical protein